VNTELIRLNWQIGGVLVEQTDRARWGDKMIERLGADLRSEFSGVTGLSVRNLKYMRSFARACPSLEEIGQQPVAQLPWGISRCCWTRSPLGGSATGTPRPA
jgi:hypothetical protein